MYSRFSDDFEAILVTILVLAVIGTISSVAAISYALSWLFHHVRFF